MKIEEVNQENFGEGGIVPRGRIGKRRGVRSLDLIQNELRECYGPFGFQEDHYWMDDNNLGCAR